VKDELRKINTEIYEYGETERDAKHLAEFAPQGGWFYRLLKWVERQCREERQLLIEDRTALQEKGERG